MAGEEKFQQFLDAVYQAAEQKANALLDETKQNKAEALRQFRRTARENAEYAYQREMKKAQASVSAEFSHTETELKEELFKQRKDITDKVFDEAEKRLLAFTGTAEYLPFLEAKTRELAQVLPEGSELFLRPADMRLASQVQAAFGKPCTVREDDSIRLGGISASCSGQFADSTLDTAMDRQREEFIRHSGLKVIV